MHTRLANSLANPRHVPNVTTLVYSWSFASLLDHKRAIAQPIDKEISVKATVVQDCHGHTYLGKAEQDGI